MSGRGGIVVGKSMSTCSCHRIGEEDLCYVMFNCAKTHFVLRSYTMGIRFRVVLPFLSQTLVCDVSYGHKFK